jgi:hypothetical protein
MTPPPPADRAGPRRVLRPGLQVVRRDDRHLQVGLDAPLRLVVEDGPDERRVLGAVRDGRPAAPATPAGHRLLDRLLGLGLLVDADLLDAALGRVAALGGDRAAVLSCFARHGDAAASRLAARTAARVLLDAPDDAAASAARLLRATGVASVVRIDLAADLAGGPDPEPGATAALVVAAGEQRRARLDPLVRAGLPHLLLTCGARGARLGPFVVPGVTACLRCLDAHHGERDPRRATVLEQSARTAAEEPVDPAQLAGALAWAVGELVEHLDGDRPGTWSATATLEGGGPPVRRAWSRHPHCGCAWDALAATG